MNTGPADLLCNTDMVATEWDNYVDSGIKYMIDNHESNVFPISTTCEKPVFSVYWWTIANARIYSAQFIFMQGLY